MSKQQKLELTHDIMAEKIWARLPEHDRLVRQVRRSLEQRYSDFKAGKGSLLGRPELTTWKAYLEADHLTDEERSFIQASEIDVEYKETEQLRLKEAAINARDEAIHSLRKAIRLRNFMIIAVLVAVALMMITAYYYLHNLSRTGEDFLAKREFKKAAEQFEKIPFGLLGATGAVKKVAQCETLIRQADSLDLDCKKTRNPVHLPEVLKLYQQADVQGCPGDENIEKILKEIGIQRDSFMSTGDFCISVKSKDGYRDALECYQMVEILSLGKLSHLVQNKIDKCRKELLKK